MKKKDRLRMIKESKKAIKYCKRTVQYAEDKGFLMLREGAKEVMLNHKLRIKMFKDR